MPAGLLPPRKEKMFSDVQPRYLEMPHRERKEYVPPPMPTYDTQRAWAGTNSRWADVREAKAHSSPATAAAAAADPLAAWSQAEEHRKLARRTIGNVPSKFLANAESRGHPEVSPRRLVEKLDDQSKLEKNWRGTHALNAHTDFDVLYRKFLKQHEGAKFMQRKKNTARSPVTEFVRHGTPIEARSRGSSPAKAPPPPPEQLQMQKRAASAQARRSVSPWVRETDPDTHIGGRWKGGGVTATSFDRLKQQSLKMQPQMAKMESHALEVVTHVHDKKVDKNFVPRVYKLSLAMQIPESARSLSTKNPGGDNSNVRAVYSIGGASRSPSRSPVGNRTNTSPQRRSSVSSPPGGKKTSPVRSPPRKKAATGTSPTRRL